MKRIHLYIFIFLYTSFAMAQEQGCNFIEINISSDIRVGNCDRWNTVSFTEYGLFCKTYRSKSKNSFEKIKQIYLFIPFKALKKDDVKEIQDYIVSTNLINYQDSSTFEKTNEIIINGNDTIIKEYIKPFHIFTDEISFLVKNEKIFTTLKYKQCDPKIDGLIVKLNKLICKDEFKISSKCPATSTIFR